jgi:hypothetical protein
MRSLYEKGCSTPIVTAAVTAKAQFTSWMGKWGHASCPHSDAFQLHYVFVAVGSTLDSFPVRFSALRRRSAARMIDPQKFETCSVTYWRYLPRGNAVCRTEEK